MPKTEPASACRREAQKASDTAVGVSRQQCSLKCNDQIAYKRPRLRLVIAIACSKPFLERARRILEPRVLSAAKFMPQHIDRVRCALDGAQHIEAHDVSGTFPDRVDRGLAIKARHDAFLDVAGTTEHIHCLVGHKG